MLPPRNIAVPPATAGQARESLHTGNPYAVEADLVIVNRSTRDRIRFGVTDALVDGREVPIRVVHRPTWWLEIALAIDDAAPF
jgi:hypothetical protein